MSEGATIGDAPGAGRAAGAASAGQLLREARMAQGMHIAALASAIKVTPRKLEALESDRFDELPDATFTRALAQTVCRTLKIDPVPVLALLPPSRSHRLEKAGPGLNTAVRERPRPLQTGDHGGIGRFALWGSVLLLVAAAAVYFMPAGWLPMLADREPGADEPAAAASATSVLVFPPAPTGADPGAPAEVRAPSEVVPGGAGALSSSAGSASGVAGAAAGDLAAPGAAGATPDVAGSATGAAADASAPAAPLLRLRARADSWVGVVDASGQTLLGRTLKAGDTVDLQGSAPLRVRIGNAAGTEVVFRGEPVPLERHTRGNLATVELK